MNNVPPAIAQAIAPFTPPEPMPVEIAIYIPQFPASAAFTRVLVLSGQHGDNRFYTTSEIANAMPFRQAIDFIVDSHRAKREQAEKEIVKPSMVVPCPACDGGWRKTPTGVVMCWQCRGTGRVATAGGEP